VPITAPKPLPKALPRYPYLRNVEKNCGREREREAKTKNHLRKALDTPLTKSRALLPAKNHVCPAGQLVGQCHAGPQNSF